jgi:DNA-binding transcriptional LysR family regulator
MTLEQVRVFVAVAERQHVTRAAEALNIAQSAVSASIAVLEWRHGAKLFNRVGRRIELTEAGALFLTEARAVLARAESADTIGFRACSWGAQPFAPRASSCARVALNEAVRAAVEAGMGAAVMSASVAAPSIEAGLLRQVNFALPERCYYALRHAERYRSRAAETLMDIIRGSRPGLG